MPAQSGINSKFDYVLGLDLGSQSLGWAVVECDSNLETTRLIDFGVRIFDDGRNPKDHQPLGVGRRLAKQTARRRQRAFRRRQALLNLLRGRNLLPQDFALSRSLAKLDPYELRRRAVRERIERHEIGRILLHLNKRRGFQSSRKDSNSDEKELSATRQGISNLSLRIGDGETLGSYLGSLRRKNIKSSVRFRPERSGNRNLWEIYPERSMITREIRAILQHQAQYHSDLEDPTLLERILHIVVEQRPLKKPKVGSCRFFVEDDRAPLALPSQQRFRILQEISNLEVLHDGEFRRLTREERDEIVAQLSLRADRSLLNKKQSELSFSRIGSRIIGDSGVEFNLAEMGRSGLTPDLAAVELSKRECFGDEWFSIPLEQQDEIVLKLTGNEEKEIQDEDAEVREWLTEHWGLSLTQAESCLHARLPDGFGRLGRRAISKLLPFLEAGRNYSESVELAGLTDPSLKTEIRDFLPYYGEVLENYTMPHPAHSRSEVAQSPEVRYGRIANPTVHIGLNQVRTVVNKIIERFGSPKVVRVELARDFAFSQKQQSDAKKRQTENRRRNEVARAEIIEAGQDPANQDNLLRWKLWKELHSDPTQRRCPFSGRMISVEDLFSARVEVEHILPFARTFDDSFSNKTICFREYNRKKLNRTPFEAFGGKPEFEEILARAATLPISKRWRFRPDAMETFRGNSPDLIARTLNDTRYLSRVASMYLRTISENVETIRGSMTSALRYSWGLSGALSDSRHKNRQDHRHHAIDAFVVACATRAFLRRFQLLTEERKLKEPSANPLHLRDFPRPHKKFSLDSIRDAASRMIVSHKQGHYVPEFTETPGPLHEETYYGIEEGSENKLKLKVRKPLEVLKRDPKDCNNIASPRLRSFFLSKCNQIESDAEWKEFLATLIDSGRIRRIRMLDVADECTVRGFKARDGAIYRYARTGNNAHADVIRIPSGNGRSKIEFCVASNFEVATATANDQPAWKQRFPAGKKVARLTRNDMVALKGGSGRWFIYRVKYLDAGNSRVVLTDPKIALEDKDKQSIRLSKTQILSGSFSKVAVGPLGDLRARSEILANLHVGSVYHYPE